MPKFTRHPRNLKGFNDYLRENFSRNNDLLRPVKKWINEISTIKVFEIDFKESEGEVNARRKALYVLGQFITFLTYRGNGAPKKITKLLEGFIHPFEEKTLTNDNLVVFGRNSKNLYLSFDYGSQYRLGLTNHLFKPYLIANSVHIRDFGDKMLIATSFLMDHIYKYHKVGFSWENLELTPEIIAINKSPELRRFISRLLDFMASSHIEEIINGLHQFKFNIRIAAEIKYISTISEVEAAAFNFTLDESLLLKRHYRKKLKSLEKLFEKVRENGNPEDYHIKSIAYVYTILGDLHFYDREYDEALIHYENASQFLYARGFQIQDDRTLDPTDFIFLVRHLLKVGLTYEKTRDYDSAFISYGKINQLIRDSARKLDFWNTASERKENLRVKRKLLENVRLIFEPLIAQFQVIEKGGPNGVTAEDVIRVQDEFQMIVQDLESVEKFLIETEFYNKIGDILYYKNGALVSKLPDDRTENKDFFLPVEIIKKERSYLLSESSSFRNFKQKRDYKVPYSAWKLYARSVTICAHKIQNLRNQVNEKFDLENPLSSGETLKILVGYLKGEFTYQNRPELKPNKKSELLVAAGSNLSDMADSLICFLTEEEKVDWLFLEKILYPHEEGKDVFSDQILLNRLEESLRNDFDYQSAFNQIFIILFTSNQYFIKAGDYYRGLFQLKKILILVRRYLELSGSSERISQKQFRLVKIIAHEAFEIADQSTKHTRRQQIHEWENILSIEHGLDEGAKATYMDSIIQHPEGKEILTVIKEIELHIADIDIVSILRKNLLATPYTVINNKFNRLFELYYKCSLNHHIIFLAGQYMGMKDGINVAQKEGRLILDELLTGLGSIPGISGLGFGNTQELLKYLICDSIYCLMEVVRSFNVFGVTYIASHASIALAHEHLGNWCNYYQIIKGQGKKDLQTERFFVELKETLIEYIGEINSQYLDIGYHFKIALQYYYSSLEVHNEGDAYKRAIEELHYLDDDFDDNLSHFCGAIERYRINTGWVRRKIQRLKENMKDIDTFQIEAIVD